METLNYNNIEINSWDIGSSVSDKIRPYWRRYYQNVQGIIFVVDSSDRNRIEEAREELWRLLGEDDLLETVLLVFATEQIKPTNAMSTAEITDRLRLYGLRNRQWRVQGLRTYYEGLYYGGLVSAIL